MKKQTRGDSIKTTWREEREEKQQGEAERSYREQQVKHIERGKQMENVTSTSELTLQDTQ